MPKGFVTSLVLPSLQRLSVINEYDHTIGPESQNASAPVEWARRYGPQLKEIGIDYGSLTHSALDFCLKQLPNITSLTMVPSMFDPNHVAKAASSWNSRSAILGHAILVKLSPSLSRDDSTLLKSSLCPKLEVISASMSKVEGAKQAADWVDLIAKRRGSAVRDGLMPISWLKHASLTFNRAANIDRAAMVDKLAGKGVNIGGLVLNGITYEDR